MEKSGNLNRKGELVSADFSSLIEKSSQSSTAVIVPTVLLALGVILIVAAGFSFNTALQLTESGVTVTGTVTEVTSRLSKRSGGQNRTKHKSHISFVDQGGQTQKAVVSDRKTIGEEIRLIYHPEAPSEARENTIMGVWGGPLAIALLGSVFLAIGGYCLTLVLQRRKDIKWLLQFGKVVPAKVVEIVEKKRRRKNRSGSASTTTGRSSRVSYALLCQWVDLNTGISHSFTSEFRSSPFSSQIVGSELSVLIDPQNTKRFLVNAPRE